MQFIPKAVLKKLYNRSSLRNTPSGVRFAVKNRLSPAKLKRVKSLVLDGETIPMAHITVAVDGGEPVRLDRLASGAPVDFPLGTQLTFDLSVQPLSDIEHELVLAFEVEPFGMLEFAVSDRPRSPGRAAGTVPRDAEDDYCDRIIRARRDFVREKTGVELEHVSGYSFDPHQSRGNIEHFTGVAQVPVGIAGPLLVHGEHAQGEFYVPLATTEGTLVASYNRGMKVIRESGGVKCAVVGDNMQRAPVFIFDDAASGRKLAEIVAGTVLAGEISLAAAISSLDWVSSHDQLGRNDPTAGPGGNS